MYLEHFGLREEPFALTTDPRFLFLSPAHAQAQACLQFAVLKGDGIVVITGAIGAGKSTLAHDAATRAENEVLVVHNTHVGATGLLLEVLSELGFHDIPASKAELLITLRRALAERFQSGNRTMLIVDEAQHLDAETLEELRMLADEQVDHEKPMSVVLVGQPSLANTLQGPGLEQVRQRIRLHFHLPPLTLDDTERYLAHRLCVASQGVPSSPLHCSNPAQLFDHDAVVVMHRFTGGVPRLINVLADLGLMAAWMEETQLVTAAMIDSAVKDLGWVPYWRRRDIELYDRGVVMRLAGLPVSMFNSARSAVGSSWAALRKRLVHPVKETGLAIAGWGDAVPATTGESRRIAAGLAAAVAVVALVSALAIPGLRSDGGGAPSVADASAIPGNDVIADDKRAITAASSRASLADTTAEALPVVETQSTADTSTSAAGSPEPQLVAMLDPTSLKVPLETMQQRAAATTEPAGPSGNEPIANGEPVSVSDNRPSIDLPSAPWLLEQSSESYAIQVFATHQPGNLSRFAETQQLDNMAYYHRRRDNQDWYVLLTGQYSSYEQARTASASLPAAVRRNKPWVRKMAVVQADIQETESSRP